MKQHTYYIKGMHCASCEILIEKKLLEMGGIKSADASTGKGQVVVMCDGQAPNPEKLSQILRRKISRCHALHSRLHHPCHR